MKYLSVLNAAHTLESDRPMMQKENYSVSPEFSNYLLQYRRSAAFPVSYHELLHYRYTDALKESTGKHTHWERVVYQPDYLEMLSPKLLDCWTLLQGDASEWKAVAVKAIDFCEYANSMPFRITVELSNGFIRFFYIKLADASRLLGLELEEMLTDECHNFLYHNQTLLENHIEGVPGDEMLQKISQQDTPLEVQLAAAFIEFEETCFLRLLGDMRSYNFVINAIETGFRIRAIDFDQQCYEGRLSFYFPSFFKENSRFVDGCQQYLSEERQLLCRKESRIKLRNKLQTNRARINDLLTSLKSTELSESYKVRQLRNELFSNLHHKPYLECGSMASILEQHFLLLQESLP